MKNIKGFTLIELLVVIAIIGVLASIVLVSLGGARERAKDARIISDMGQIRTIATIHEGNTGAYTGLCDEGEITTLRDDATNQGGTNYSCNVDASTFCVKVQMNNDNWWCVDSALRSQQYTADPGTVCTLTPFTCQ